MVYISMNISVHPNVNGSFFARITTTPTVIRRVLQSSSSSGSGSGSLCSNYPGAVAVGDTLSSSIVDRLDDMYAKIVSRGWRRQDPWSTRGCHVIVYFPVVEP